MLFRQKNINIGLHLDIYIFFQTLREDRDHWTLHFDFGLHYLTFIQGYICVKNQKLLAHFPADFLIDLDETYSATTSCFTEAQPKFVLKNWYSRERTLFMWTDEIHL